MTTYISNYTELGAEYSWEFKSGWLYVTMGTGWDRLYPSTNRIAMQCPEGRARFVEVRNNVVTYDMWLSLAGGRSVATNVNIQILSTLDEPQILREADVPVPGAPRIIGKVTDSVLGTPLALVSVAFSNKSTLTDPSGNYVLTGFLGMSGPVTFTLLGYVTTSKMITSPASGDLVVNMQLVSTAAPPPYAYRVFPAPPAGFPAKFVPWYQELDGACADKDQAKVFAVLREYMWEEGSPVVFLAAVGTIAGVIAIITAVVGTYPFAGFLIEESLQTVDMAVYQAQVNKEYDLAQRGLNKKKEILSPNAMRAVIKEMLDSFVIAGGILPAGTGAILDALLSAFIKTTPLTPAESYQILGTLPFANILAALAVYMDASAFKVTIDQEIINRKIEMLEVPAAGDVLGMADAINYGQDTSPFMPKRYSILIIDPNVSGGELLVDGVGMSVIFPYSWEVTPGTHTVEVRSPGYYAVTDSVQVDPYTVKVHKPFLTALPEEATKGSLEVISTPDKANIFLNGQLYTYPTNAVISGLDPGSYSVEVRKTGYVSDTRSVTITAGKRSSVNVYLVAEAAPPVEYPPALEKEVVVPLERMPTVYNAWKYTLRTVAKDTGAALPAKIFIDGEDTGKWTPYYFYFEPVTSYVLRFERWGYVPAELTIATEALPS